MIRLENTTDNNKNSNNNNDKTIRTMIQIVVHVTCVGRGDDTLGSPPRAQICQFELFELKLLNPSFSSLSSC